MFAPSKIKVGARAVALALALATSSFSAHAVLERAGPVSIAPQDGGFPAWYQDTTGIALEFCSPNAAEVAGGWCLLLPPVAAPETFPSNFFIEHFYYAAVAVMAHQGGSRSRLVLAEEASFANGFNVIPGEQITFSRIRVILTPVPVTGTYRFIHPYGEEVLQGTAGDRIFFTDDVGFNCIGNFDCSLKSRLGPFLLPSAIPGGAEMAPLTAANPTPDTNPANFAGVFAPTPYPGTGKAYIADPSRIGPVTGSSLPNFIDSTGASRNHNIFRIEGPPGSALGVNPATGAIVDWAETTSFSLMGRLYDGAMPGAAKVDRASYTRNATGLKVDVLATGAPSTTSRLPTQVVPAKVAPTLSFFNAACAGTVDPVSGAIVPPFSAPLGAGVVETQMLSQGEQYWGQVRPLALPTSVCLKNGNARDVFGNIVPAFSSSVVTDEVTITKAIYDTTLGTLTVAATSSDATVPPVLNLAYGNFIGSLAGGTITVPNVAVPPSAITVTSSALGSNDFMVATGFPGAAAPGAPVAANDTFTFLEDSGAHVLSILANDLNAVGGTVTLTSLPTLGTAVVNANGTVTYTSRLNANGPESFTYTVTVGTQVSSPATVAINLTPVNDPPVSVNDTASVTVNTPLAINVLANDTDPDGKADLKDAASVTQPQAGATITGLVGGVAAGGIVNFNATAQGTYTFTYKARDQAGVSSVNTGTVTVTVLAPFTVGINKNQYTASTSNLAVEGVTSDPGSPTVTVVFLDSAGVVLATPQPMTTVATAGKWKLSVTVAKPVGAVSIRASMPSGAVSLASALVLK